MKRILGLAALMGQLLASAIGKETGIEPAQYRHQYGVKRQVRQAYHAGPRPTDARWWHDLKQPIQCRKLQAAKDKREERAAKLSRDAATATNNNWAHGIGKRGLHLTPVPEFSGRLNPFYIAK